MGKISVKNTMHNGNVSAGFWVRTVAFIFDLLVINLIIIWPFQGALSKFFGNDITSSFSRIENSLPSRIYIIIFMISILALLYFTFFDWYMGQTPGMMLFNIMSVSFAGDISFWQALLRNIFVLPFFPFYIFWLIEPIHLIFYKQRFLEKISNTGTVSAPKNNFYSEYKLQKV